MYVRVNSTPNSPRKSVQIVEGTRDKHTGKVKIKIVRHMGIAISDTELAQLKDMAAVACITLEKERDKQLKLPLEGVDDTHAHIATKKLGRPCKKKLEDIAPTDTVKLSDLVEEKRINEGVNDIAGKMFDDLGFDSIFKSKKDTEILKHFVLARFVVPHSKDKTRHWLAEHQDVHYEKDRPYHLLDKIYQQIPTIKKMVYLQTKHLFPEKLDILFFDVTTLYFESCEADDLKACGFSKDHKHHQVQVVLALATNGDGLPIGYELFAGNTAEITTLLRCVGKWRQDFKIENICVVADRGLLSEDNLALLEEQNFEYVIGCPLRKLSQPLKAQILDEDGYKIGAVDQTAVWVKKIPLQNGRTLIPNFSQKRAYKDAQDRQKLLEKLEKKVGKKGSIKNLISNRSFFKYVEENGTSTVGLDPDKIAKDAAWDGMHGIITNKKDPDAWHLLERYRRLWVIEESFRINKHNLQMRPIYHYKKERIEAHIALCYMAFALARHLHYRIKLRQVAMSLDDIRETLLSVQASVLVHTQTKDRYKIPSATSHKASQIYRAFDMKRDQHPAVYL